MLPVPRRELSALPLSPPPSLALSLSAVLPETDYRRLNTLAIAQSVVGALGMLLCILSIVHIYGHRRDKRSISARLVLGMLLSNLIYAAVDVAPTELRMMSGPECGYYVIGPRATDVAAECVPSGMLFLGVWSTTMYELMMVLVSTHTLRTGEGDIPRSRERLMHLVCVVAGVSALLVYFLRCRDINLELADILATVDAKPKRLDEAQTRRLVELQTEFTGLPGMLWGWALAPATFALLCWVYQRLLYREMLGLWDEAKAQHAARQLRHHFGPFLTHFSAPPHPHTYRVLRSTWCPC